MLKKRKRIIKQGNSKIMLITSYSMEEEEEEDILAVNMKWVKSLNIKY